MFQDSLIPDGKGNRLARLGGFVMVGLMLAVSALLPLVYYQHMIVTEMWRERIMAPPLFKPAAVQVVSVERIPRVRVQSLPQILYQPTRVPMVIAEIVEPPAPTVVVGVIEGIPGGIPQFTSLQTPLPAAPPIVEEKPREAVPDRIRVGGNVQAARLISQITPQYPPLARTARQQGVVKLSAVIGRDGSIQELQLLSGPPLLVQAALDTVRQWQYQPTMLNGVAVEVVTVIDVNFTLQ